MISKEENRVSFVLKWQEVGAVPFLLLEEGAASLETENETGTETETGAGEDQGRGGGPQTDTDVDPDLGKVS